MRKRLYQIIEIADENDRMSNLYDIAMMAVIFVSLIPLGFKVQTPLLIVIDKITVSVFILDYLLRLVTADLKLKKGGMSFILYPLTFMALIDMLSILPSLIIISNGFKLLKIMRLLKSLRVFRALKTFRYSKSIMIIIKVFEKQKDSLMIVVWFAIGYVLISALLVFNVEPDTFDSFFDAVYWATVSLTTMGYGDIYPTSNIGRIVTMLSAILGIAIVALPASIITAGYMDIVNEKNDQDQGGRT